MPGVNYEAGNVSYGIVATLASYPTVLVQYCPETTALSTVHPAPPPTPSPHLVSCFAPYTLQYFTPPLPCLCPSVPVQRHEYDYEYEQYPAHLHGGSC